MKSQQNFHTREEIDQLVEEIYRALETTEERLDGRCDDIYFPMDLSISALTSKIEVMQGELVEIQSYIARRLEASSSIDRHNNKSTDIHHRTSVDDATNRGRLVPKMTSYMSDTYYHEEEISADTYATLRRHQFNLESLEERLQRMENTTATMKEKWHRGDEAMRDFTGTCGSTCQLFTLAEIVLKEPKLTYNTKLDTTACLGAWYAWDQILQTSLEAEYETEYSASIETHTATSIDSGHQISTNIPHEESVDSRPDDWENDYYNPTIAAYTGQHLHTEEYDEDYEDERATEYKAILDEEDTLLHHSIWKRNAPSIDIPGSPSIDIPGSPSIDTQPHQRNRKRASTNIANSSSIDVEVKRMREGDYSIGSWADDHHHESYAVKKAIYEPEADELHEGFTYEELLNMQRRAETAQHQSEIAWGRTKHTHPINRAHRSSIDINPSTSIDTRSKPITTVSERDKFNNEYLTPDEFGIFRDPDGHAKAIDGRLAIPLDHRSTLPSQHRSTNNQSSAEELLIPTVPGDSTGKKKYQYGVYKDEQGYARDLHENTIRFHNTDIKRVLERASRDEPSYICLPEHANLFTQTKLVPEIYTKDEINEMFYGVCGEQENNKEAFQMKLDGVYYPLSDSIS
ncbi:hypothetical protein F2Q69_00022168 [Brassica cretica]|uniref:Uncharacterized protein n=1 Tax=Brassica cretica TaxID=69181 RepID=A0A8S9Q8J5_BRACR|nr:hypothetical protein F2Q69_00022168 [Brassica cretica]